MSDALRRRLRIVGAAASMALGGRANAAICAMGTNQPGTAADRSCSFAGARCSGVKQGAAAFIDACMHPGCPAARVSRLGQGALDGFTLIGQSGLMDAWAALAHGPSNSNSMTIRAMPASALSAVLFIWRGIARRFDRRLHGEFQRGGGSGKVFVPVRR